MSTNDIPSSVDYQINKSSSKGITIGIMIAIGVTAFFAGMYVTNVNSRGDKYINTDPGQDEQRLNDLEKNIYSPDCSHRLGLYKKLWLIVYTFHEKKPKL